MEGSREVVSRKGREGEGGRGEGTVHILSFPQKSTKAPQAGGKIHTDFERGFK